MIAGQSPFDPADLLLVDPQTFDPETFDPETFDPENRFQILHSWIRWRQRFVPIVFRPAVTAIARLPNFDLRRILADPNSVRLIGIRLAGTR